MGTLQFAGDIASDQQESGSEVNIAIDGASVTAVEGELLVEAVLRHKEIPHICYHSPLMGPIQTCDTCMVEVDGKLVRCLRYQGSRGNEGCH